MKLLSKSLAILWLFGAAQLAQAVPIVQLTWTDTTGSGVPGSSYMTADAGDEVRLLISVVDPDAEILGASLSLQWDDTALSALSAEECPQPENTVAGICDPALSPVFTPVNPGVTLSLGEATGFDALNMMPQLGGLVPGESLFLGAIDFVVGPNAGEELISVFYRDGEDGIVYLSTVLTADGTAILDARVERPVPVPATLLLLGLGLLGLRFARTKA